MQRCIELKYNIFFVISSQFLYDLCVTEGLPSLHDTRQLRRWLIKPGKELGITIRLTATMMTKLYKRVRHTVTTAKKLRHGRQRMNFLENSWSIQLSSKDIRPQHEVDLENQVKETDEQKKKL